MQVSLLEIAKIWWILTFSPADIFFWTGSSALLLAIPRSLRSYFTILSWQHPTRLERGRTFAQLKRQSTVHGRIPIMPKHRHSATDPASATSSAVYVSRLPGQRSQLKNKFMSRDDKRKHGYRQTRKESMSGN